MGIGALFLDHIILYPMSVGLAFPFVALHLLSKTYHMSWRQEIVKIELVLNWKQVQNDHISRHLRVTNRKGDVDWINVQSISPIIQPRFFYSTPFRRKISGIFDRVMFKAEDEILLMSVLKPDYAINKKILRAVLNGYSIDMTVPCTLHLQNKANLTKSL